ncbi:hypothetical protein FORC22_4824 (plasmid) [Vibrio parahaemolyticus]|nr:hypothetical protein FORC22_4824 [Vibrio parahaemolyticus]
MTFGGIIERLTLLVFKLYDIKTSRLHSSQQNQSVICLAKQRTETAPKKEKSSDKVTKMSCINRRLLHKANKARTLPRYFRLVMLGVF